MKKKKHLECFDTMSSLIPWFPNSFDDDTFIFVFSKPIRFDLFQNQFERRQYTAAITDA